MSDDLLAKLDMMAKLYAEAGVDGLNGHDWAKQASARIAALEAQVAAADGIATMLENVLSVMQTPDQQMCCDGRECGCQGSTVYEEAEFYARQELDAYLATKGETK